MDELANRAAADLAFAISGTRDAHGWAFAVTGDLDLGTVPRLRFALAEAFARSPRDVVVDLEDVEFFDLSALHLFAETARRLDLTGGQLFLRGLSPFQHRILVTYGLTRLASGAWAESVTIP